MRLALCLLLVGCGALPSVADAGACTPREVACMLRQEDPERERRCFMTCSDSGEWIAQECLPMCGRGRAMEFGANGTSCELPNIPCVNQ